MPLLVASNSLDLSRYFAFACFRGINQVATKTGTPWVRYVLHNIKRVRRAFATRSNTQEHVLPLSIVCGCEIFMFLALSFVGFFYFFASWHA